MWSRGLPEEVSVAVLAVRLSVLPVTKKDVTVTIQSLESIVFFRHKSQFICYEVNTCSLILPYYG